MTPGASSSGPSAIEDHSGASLTRREREVLLLLKEGITNSEISERLVISPQTTKHHLAAIYHKLGAENRTQALTKAVALGLVDLD